MRYWSYLSAKLLVAAAIPGGLYAGLAMMWPSRYLARDLAYTTAVGICFLIWSGLSCLCLLDQRYRCRVCLRRLRMPIETGSWSRMLLLGRPRTEYICTYGHGKLNVEEVQISGSEPPEWTPQAGMWEELSAASGPKTDGTER